MNIPPTPAPDTNADPYAVVDRVAQWYFLGTGFLLADVWFPRAVVTEIGRRMASTDESVGTAAVDRLIASGWLRAAPNDRWLKLLPSDELRALWERQPDAARQQARQLVQNVLLQQAHELRQTTDDETLALVLRQLVHLARLAYAAKDPEVVAMLMAIGAGFERLGMDAEARTAFRDATAALHRQRAVHEKAP